MILKNGSDLIQHFLDFIEQTFDELRNGEFKEQFDNFPCEVKLHMLSGTDVIYYDIFAYRRGHFTRKYIFEELTKYRYSEYRTLMTARWGFSLNEPDNTLILTNLSITIHASALYRLILDHIADLNTYKNVIRMSIRHEIGHLMDYSRFHGKHVSEYIRYSGDNKKELDEYYKWIGDNPHVDQDEQLRKYYSIACESTANMLTGFDVEEYLKMDGKIQNMKLCDIEINAVHEDS